MGPSGLMLLVPLPATWRGSRCLCKLLDCTMRYHLHNIYSVKIRFALQMAPLTNARHCDHQPRDSTVHRHAPERANRSIASVRHGVGSHHDGGAAPTQESPIHGTRSQRLVTDCEGHEGARSRACWGSSARTRVFNLAARPTRRVTILALLCPAYAYPAPRAGKRPPTASTL